MISRRTLVVDGPLAFKMRRIEIARARETGVEVLILPRLAARLAGGFLQPALADTLHPAIGAALAAGGFQHIEAIRDLPGMIRAVGRTLTSVWRADFTLEAHAAESDRIADLTLLEARIRAALPAAMLIPPDLREAALARLAHAPTLLGEVLIDGVLDIDPVWRPLIAALARETTVVWRAPEIARPAWFEGAFTAVSPPALAPAPTADLCVDPHAEVIEALRWARALLSSGEVEASGIAIAAAETSAWDEHVLVLARSAWLPIHFSHGVPALDTPDGQTCAALADVLLRGLSYDRVSRLLRRTSDALGLADDWARGLPPGAALTTRAQWRAALTRARSSRSSGETVEAPLLALLDLLDQGPDAAAPAGERVLAGRALRLWRDALRAAPAQALAMTLGGLRAVDPGSPGASVSWGPAAHLAACPRPFVRLLGLTSRGWPRADTEDALLPAHIVDRSRLGGRSRIETDLRHFEVIRRAAFKGLALSRSHRSADGALQGPSRLWPADARSLPRARIPAHAFNEADRLLARSSEAAVQPHLAQSRRCWRAWRAEELTAHDGAIAPQHPLVAQALARILPSAAVRRLLRDPLAFLWCDALGWRSRPRESPVLELDAASFGELTHELIGQAIDRLQAGPGVGRATAFEVEAAIEGARAAAEAAWPLSRSVPPPLLWRATLARAERMAREALRFATLPGAIACAELPFGRESEAPRAGAPWDTRTPITLGPVRIGGRVDRLDVADRQAEVSDYKTGKRPSGNLATVVLGHGVELQRVIYGVAARQLIPDAAGVTSRLVYLDGVSPAEYALSGEALDRAAADLAGHLTAAADLVLSGHAPAGPDSREDYNDLRLALPADLNGYHRRKGASIAGVTRPLAPLWNRR